MDSLTDYKIQSQVREHLRAGEYERALELILAVAPSDELEIIQHASSPLEEIPDEVIAAKVPLRKRLAVLGGATTQFLIPFVRLFALRRGVSLSFYESDFALFEQEVWSNSPALLEFAPDVIHFHVCSRNLALGAGEDAADQQSRPRFSGLFSSTALLPSGFPAL